MIQIDIKRKQNLISEIVIRDHAGYGNKGEDLVCAGVSCIAIGTLNAIDQTNSGVCDLEMRDAYIRITVKLFDHEEVHVMLNMMRIQLMTMQETYENFIQITDQEV